ncbi:MAG: ABC transporter ATP-binding protein [Deltaproteobacteria bacterium]|jgi:branched-chain amino acid transport system ATP-binding protein|nr:ABC transporter ATP-binding protein [Desulfobacula sp.]MBT5546214.1 ABC transporter ATP-binding protein [Desulfobacula sp.]MBT6615534.1 ABC transporter ATP-binding protein [Deltaproteobacteria bacterium]MBT7713045.1 ABC transporter ATP-binding protein [Deltaproteobacteria bacterium]MBT7889588.1 ABC transporter ATP-binding protein [Deltaproteobacteria bacterium]
MIQNESNEVVLSVRDLECKYGELKVLHKASLDINQGEVVALFGPNGHGKSTLLKAICGLNDSPKGSVIFMGSQILGTPSDRIVEKGLAYISEARNIFNDMSVLENLRLGAYNRRARKKVNENLEFVYSLFPRLFERREQMAGTLSGGESRMLAVGRGLMSDAKLLLVDEPSIGLSPIMKKTVFGAINRIKKTTDISVLVVEQEVDYALAVADRIYLLKKGKVILERKAGDIVKSEIEKAYF